MSDEAAWIDACAVADLDANGRHVVTIDGVSILLLRLSDRVHALRNECTHLDLPIANGRVSGGTLMCLYHGARFCIADGRPISGPAVRPITTYRTRLADGRIEIHYVPAAGALLAAFGRKS